MRSGRALAMCSASCGEDGTFSDSVLLKLECASEPPGELVQTHGWAPPPPLPILYVWARGGRAYISNKLPGDGDAAGSDLRCENPGLDSPRFGSVFHFWPPCGMWSCWARDQI